MLPCCRAAVSVSCILLATRCVLTREALPRHLSMCQAHRSLDAALVQGLWVPSGGAGRPRAQECGTGAYPALPRRGRDGAGLFKKRGSSPMGSGHCSKPSPLGTRPVCIICPFPTWLTSSQAEGSWLAKFRKVAELAPVSWYRQAPCSCQTRGHKSFVGKETRMARGVGTCI